MHKRCQARIERPTKKSKHSQLSLNKQFEKYAIKKTNILTMAELHKRQQ